MIDKIDTIHIREMLLAGHSRPQMLKIVEYIDRKPARFAALVSLLLTDEYRVVQRAAWPLSYCVQQHPFLIREHLESLLHCLEHPRHAAVQRNILRLLCFVELPDALHGRIMSTCFDLVQAPTTPVASKAFALSILGKLAEKYPEIGNEIRLIIEEQLPTASPGFRSKARKVLKGLDRNSR